MPSFAEVRHTQWIAAPVLTVRAQFAGRRVRPLLESQIRKEEVSAAALEDRADIEQRGYPRLAA